MMTRLRLPLAALALLALTICTGPLARAATPAPHAKAKPIVVNLPNVQLHAQYTVEVNAKGQVVRVETGKGNNKYPMWNAQTYGNALQMWIRHPDGTAEVGRYQVTYDYDPRTKLVHRGIRLLSTGGTWADAKGAADDMMDEANKEYEEYQKSLQAQGKSLPPLENIVGPTPAPSST